MRPRLQGLMDRMSRRDRRASSSVETVVWSLSPLIGEDDLVRAGDELDALTAELMCAEDDAIGALDDDADAGDIPVALSLLLTREGFDSEAARAMAFDSVKGLVAPLLEPLDLDEETAVEIEASAAALLLCGLWLGRRVSRDAPPAGGCLDAE